VADWGGDVMRDKFLAGVALALLVADGLVWLVLFAAFS